MRLFLALRPDAPGVLRPAHLLFFNRLQTCARMRPELCARFWQSTQQKYRMKAKKVKSSMISDAPGMRPELALKSLDKLCARMRPELCARPGVNKINVLGQKIMRPGASCARRFRAQRIVLKFNML